MLIIAHRILQQAYQNPKKKWAILIKNGRILTTGPAESLQRSFSRNKVVDLHEAIVMPGLVNVHTHLEIPSLHEKIAAGTYSSWVLNLLKIKRSLSQRDYRTAATENIRSLLESGTTTIGEISTHRTSPKLLAESGLRAHVFQEIISMDPAKGTPSPASLLQRDRSLIRFVLSPHSPHTVSEQALGVIRDLQERKHFRLSMHAAETKAEGRLLRREKGDLDRLYSAAGWRREWSPEAPSSIALLGRIGILGPSLLLVHAVDVSDKDIAMIKRSDTAVSHCPRSNHSLHVGTMPLKKMLDAGIPVGLGTDSLASVPTLNLWDEMRFAYNLHRKNGISPQDILYLATMGGAKALGMEKEIGSLESGKKADIIAVPLPRKNTGDIRSDLLRETESSIMTMVNGKILHMDKAG